jgi:hypothetical protein
MFDTDNSGSLQSHEIVELIKAVYGYKALEENARVKSILSKLDVNGDGVVSLAEFLRFNKAVCFTFPFLLSSAGNEYPVYTNPNPNLNPNPLQTASSFTLSGTYTSWISNCKFWFIEL